jgi:Iron-containing redox enzyme
VSVPSVSEMLRWKLDLVAPVLFSSSERVWSSSQIVDLYPIYLRTMHGIVRSATPLLLAASERARELAPCDEVAAGLTEYLARHAEEERGHDVWLLEDLEALGGDPAAAADAIPSARVATFVGAQYYWLRHKHPVALLGHMAVVEGYSPAPGFADRLQRLTGYPPAAFRAVRRHERLDIHHKRELYEIIDALPLQLEHEALIGISAIHTISAAIGVLDEIHSRAPTLSPVPR